MNIKQIFLLQHKKNISSLFLIGLSLCWFLFGAKLYWGWQLVGDAYDYYLWSLYYINEPISVLNTTLNRPYLYPLWIDLITLFNSSFIQSNSFQIYVSIVQFLVYISSLNHLYNTGVITNKSWIRYGAIVVASGPAFVFYSFEIMAESLSISVFIFWISSIIRARNTNLSVRNKNIIYCIINIFFSSILFMLKSLFLITWFIAFLHLLYFTFIKYQKNIKENINIFIACTIINLLIFTPQILLMTNHVVIRMTEKNAIDPKFFGAGSLNIWAGTYSSKAQNSSVKCDNLGLHITHNFYGNKKIIFQDSEPTGNMYMWLLKNPVRIMIHYFELVNYDFSQINITSCNSLLHVINNIIYATIYATITGLLVFWKSLKIFISKTEIIVVIPILGAILQFLVGGFMIAETRYGILIQIVLSITAGKYVEIMIESKYNIRKILSLVIIFIVVIIELYLSFYIKEDFCSLCTRKNMFGHI